MTAQLITYTTVVTVPISHIFQENLSTFVRREVKACSFRELSSSGILFVCCIPFVALLGFDILW